ncbi:peptidoglycan-binding domain-containing protein [Streptomyces sp. NPDC007851]|uniref:peptidoglycan-binding domain-containing protein n=1 Tax=Streptomyces sp. NPDC007851 TaxID=3155008 RepID=UPI0034066C3B
MIRQSIAAAAAAVLMTLGSVTAAEAATPALHAAPASAQAYSCSYYWTVDTYYYEFAGHSTTWSAVPSTTSVSSAGVEAQCLLKDYANRHDFPSLNPGTIDGVFGRNSQTAMKAFQRYMNSAFSAGLTVDGLPGPQSWWWLRYYGGLEG